MDLFMITTNLKNQFPIVREPVDLNPQRAAVLVILFNKNAIRETMEEIGLEVAPSNVIGCLPKVQTRTGFEITPFVAILKSLPDLTVCEDEVHEVLEMPLTALLSTHQRDIGYKPSEEMVVYWHKCHRIWGASAKILRQIENLASI